MVKDEKTSQDQALIASLQDTITTLHLDIEAKEVALGRLAREKETLLVDLLKKKRSNTSLVKQLEDERLFYYKEKEVYCQEMNDCKRLRRTMSSSTTSIMTNTYRTSSQVVSESEELHELRKTLSKTHDTNCKLSIKFLRMQKSKTAIRNELAELKLKHCKMINDIQVKINQLSADFEGIVKDAYSTPISPSNRRYLEVVKQNGMLINENLCLKSKVDQLLSKLKNTRVQQHSKSGGSDLIRPANNNKQRSVGRLPKTPDLKCCRSDRIVTIFERINKIPKLAMIKDQDDKFVCNNCQIGKNHSDLKRSSLLRLDQDLVSKSLDDDQQDISNINAEDTGKIMISRCRSAPNIMQIADNNRIGN